MQASPLFILANRVENSERLECLLLSVLCMNKCSRFSDVKGWDLLIMAMLGDSLIRAEESAELNKEKGRKKLRRSTWSAQM